MRASTIRLTLPLVAVVSAILFFGLRAKDYDFTNNVHWLESRPGLRFNKYGIVYAERALPLDPKEFTIEIALRPARQSQRGFNSILLFHGGDDADQLIMGQWKSSIILMNGNDYSHRRRIPRISFDTTAVSARELLVAATSGSKGTQVFVNGSLSASSKDLVLSMPQGAGGTRLVIGNSLYARNSWAGEIYGLALYDSIVSKQEAAGRYRRWAAEGRFPSAGDGKPNLLYRFDEIGGRIVYERAAHASNLFIPDRAAVLKRRFLVRVSDFENPLDLIVDVCINTIGFIPFGFVLAAALRSKRVRFSLFWAVFAGFLLSLSIEIAQAWLPSRHSSALDLALNTLGTILGAFACGRKSMAAVRLA